MRSMLRGMLVLSLAMAGSAALAQGETDDEDLLAAAGDDLLNAPTALDLYVSGDVQPGRRDVREVTMSPPPSGPATPVPFCAPSAPVCP